MFRRIGLFLLTNFLVVITVSLILGVVMPMLGIQVEGTIGLAVFCGVFGMAGAFISLAISRGVRSPCPSSRILMNQAFSANRHASM